MKAMRMPSLGADMTAGTLLEWHVEPGDRVRRGDIVATVDTSKAEIEIETFDGGVIDEILVEPGTKVPVGTEIARIREAESEAAEAARATPPPPAGENAAPAQPPLTGESAAPTRSPSLAEPSPSAAAAPAPSPHVHRVRVSPLARRIAAERGVDVAAVTGTGPGDTITRADVERAAQAAFAAAPAQAPPPALAEHRPAADRHASLRAAIGALMARSKREIPHYHVAQVVDMSAARTWLDAYNAARPPRERLLLAVLLLKAAALATHDVPEINGTFDNGVFAPADGVHLGVAVSLRGGGVIAPAIHDADGLSLTDLMQALRELTGRVRRGVLRSSDVEGGSITVTSLGDQGVDAVYGVIFPPQVGLVGFGRVAERPWAAGGMVGARPTVIASLAADHRVSDGHRGGLYLASIDRHLQEPEQL